MDEIKITSLYDLVDLYSKDKTNWKANRDSFQLICNTFNFYWMQTSIKRNIYMDPIRKDMGNNITFYMPKKQMYFQYKKLNRKYKVNPKRVPYSSYR